MNFLVFNCGSSSQNYKLYQVAPSGLDLICKGKAHRVGVKGSEPSFIEHTLDGRTSKVTIPLTDHAVAATLILDYLEQKGLSVDALGHRFVNGGECYQDSILITPDVSSGLDAVLPLAPIHNPNSLSVIRVCQRRFPGIPQTLSFDTAFHAGLEPAAYTYALPSELRQRFGLRKFGYHGLSYHYVTRRAAEYLERPLESLRMVACHLGTGGSSVTAILNGRSLDTSMGYSPLAGLMMSTRSGDLDARVVIDLLKSGNSPATVSDLLNKESGLLGVSGISSDIRDLLKTADDRATLAVELYTQRLKKTIAGFIALLGGIDVLLFTDDIGLQNPAIRAMACQGLEWAGVRLDEQANLNAPLDRMSDIGQGDTPVRVLVTPTDEERVIADETLRLLTEAKNG
jgi:acetate kinase